MPTTGAAAVTGGAIAVVWLGGPGAAGVEGTDSMPGTDGPDVTCAGGVGRGRDRDHKTPIAATKMAATIPAPIAARCRPIGSTTSKAAVVRRRSTAVAPKPPGRDERSARFNAPLSTPGIAEFLSVHSTSSMREGPLPGLPEAFRRAHPGAAPGSLSPLEASSSGLATPSSVPDRPPFLASGMDSETFVGAESNEWVS